MKEIDAKYRVLGIFPCTIHGQIPESWDDVTPVQLIAISNMISMGQTQLKSLAEITSLPYRIIRKLSDFEIFNILQPLSFISDYRPRNCFILPSFGHLLAPRHKLENVTWGQFIYIEHYFDNIMAAEKINDDDLNNFITHLYLPKGEAFNHEDCVQRASSKPLTSASFNKKYAVVLNYRLIREWLATIYKLIFQKKLASRNPQQETSNQKPATRNQKPGSWTSVHDQIVGDDIINREKYADLNVHIVFRFLTKKIKENVRKR